VEVFNTDMSQYDISRYMSKIGRKGAQRSNAGRTAEQRSAMAKKASLSRRSLKQPGSVPLPEAPWYGLFDEADPDQPEMVAYSQDKQELRRRAQREPRAWTIEALDYDPRTRVKVTPEFRPDAAACVKAVRALDSLHKGRR
jgi:hypothetical protein